MAHRSLTYAAPTPNREHRLRPQSQLSTNSRTHLNIFMTTCPLIENTARSERLDQSGWLCTRGRDAGLNPSRMKKVTLPNRCGYIVSGARWSQCRARRPEDGRRRSRPLGVRLLSSGVAPSRIRSSFRGQTPPGSRASRFGSASFLSARRRRFLARKSGARGPRRSGTPPRAPTRPPASSARVTFERFERSSALVERPGPSPLPPDPVSPPGPSETTLRDATRVRPRPGAR